MPKTASGITAKIEKGNLVITIPASKKPELSESGKTLKVASSQGFQETELEIDGKPVFINLHAYIYAQEKKSKRG